MTKVVFAAIGLALAWFILSFSGGLRPRGTTTSINELVLNPGAHNGERISVTGTVGEGAAAFGVGAYRLESNGGEILVTSRAGVPATGATVHVQGTWRQVLVVGDRQVWMLIQT